MSNATTQNRSYYSDDTDRSSESMLANVQCASEECVREYPLASTMISMGAGAALGLLIATTIGRREETRRTSYISQLGNQIASSIGNVVPDSLSWKR